MADLAFADKFFSQLVPKLWMMRYLVIGTLAFAVDDEISRHRDFLFL